MEEARTSADNQDKIPGVTLPLSKIRNSPQLLASRPPAELVSIVQHLSRVADRLRTENENLKKYGTSQSKYMEAVKEIKRLKKELEEKSDDRRVAESELRKVAKAEEENTKLRREVRLEKERKAKLVAQLREVESEKQRLAKELTAARKAISGLEKGGQEANPDDDSEEEMNVENLLKRLNELVREI